MKKTLQFTKLVFTTLCIFIVTNSTSAQIRIPNGTTGVLNQSDPHSNILIGTANDLHENNPDVFHQLGVDANTVTYGSRTAVYGISKSNADSGSSQGIGRGSLGSTSGWAKNGTILGTGGTADSVFVLDNPNPVWDGHSGALGGSFGVNIFDPIPAASTSSGTYTIAGMRGTLDGNITNYPTQGVVAAMYADDRIQGSGTWAGYFTGRVAIGGTISTPFVTPSLPSTSTSTYKLFVCGGIIGQELFINNSAWCDYVFEEDYNLLPLEKVEEHIKENGHLHNTPSANQIEQQDGFEMGEMTRNQQEKIEEIYLHLIDMQKRIVALEKENATLRQAVETENK